MMKYPNTAITMGNTRNGIESALGVGRTKRPIITNRARIPNQSAGKARFKKKIWKALQEMRFTGIPIRP